MHQHIEPRRGVPFTRSLDDLLRLALEADWAAREEGCTAPQGNWSVYHERNRRKAVLPSIWIKSYRVESKVPEGPMAQQQPPPSPPPQPIEPSKPETWRDRPSLL
jgi:hypothetical protein